MDLASSWVTENKTERQKALVDFIASAKVNGEEVDYLDLVLAPTTWGIFASDGPHFRYAIFGRDSIIVAEDLLDLRPELVKHIILTLASLQGVKFDEVSEEEPGRIHHEYRRREFGDIVVPEHSLGILHNLQDRWGGRGTDRVTYYGSCDATPLFVRLVSLYVSYYGQAILGEGFTRPDGELSTIGDSVAAAVDWLCSKLEKSKFGILEYRRVNPLGLINQDWKDSETACLNSDGSFPDFDGGVGLINLQGYAYDALSHAKQLFPDSDKLGYWSELASNLQANALKLMWMRNDRFFAQGVYHDKTDQPRQIDTFTSNSGVVLDSALLTDLPVEQRNYYVYNIASVICSNDFLTNAGVRSRGLRHAHIPSFIDYHGTYTVWPKEANAIARGLRKHGLNQLAHQIENRILNNILLAGEFYEFFYVEKDGGVWYDRDLAMQHFSAESPGGSISAPEASQAWTISAVYRILSLNIRGKQVGAGAVENSIADQMPKVEVPSSLKELNALVEQYKRA